MEKIIILVVLVGIFSFIFAKYADFKEKDNK